MVSRTTSLLGSIFRNPSSNVSQCSEVKMSCLAKVVHVLIEGQHVVVLVIIVAVRIIFG